MLCSACHEDVDDTREWPEARQLAVLMESRPGHMDLAAYNVLKGYGPNRITTDDIDEWTEEV